MEERGSGASHPGAAAINRSPRDVSEQLAENTTLVLQARTVVLGASATVFGALQRTQQAGVLDVQVAEQGVDLTRADCIRLLLLLLAWLLLASWPGLLLLMMMLLLLP